MSSTYSPDLRIELIGTGDQAGVWGNTTNTNLNTVLESAIAGYTSVSITSANQALTANYGAADQARFAVIALTTTTGANFAVYAPPASKQYTIYNASSYTATILNSTVIGNTTAAGTGVAIPAGKVMTVWSDGTNFVQQNTHFTNPTLYGPTLQGPALGTPTSGVMTNVTGLPVATGISGLGTGVATALAVNTGSAGAPVVNGGVLGTPSSGTLTNVTGLPLTSGVTGTLPVGNGGTGATSITSGALIKGAGTGAFSAASAADIVGQIGSTAVQNATNATNATTAANGGVTSVNGSTGAVQSVLVSGTQTNLSGTAVTFSGIPSWVKRVTVMVSALSTNGTSIPELRVGTSGGVVSTGYSTVSFTSTGGAGTFSDGIALVSSSQSASYAYYGFIVLTTIGSNIWVAQGGFSIPSVAGVQVSSGITLGSALTQVQLTMVNGTDNFDAGVANILYE